ncbi:related to ketoreductase [Serendipita indica DSM 11827]|uniref:Related to ketoreductase n=1 Tax=Serendipita indica (strain DSM 11827) TaxID=1109443 RepID=G4T7T2_SERID|nr:related to ketoreductase [Serendipita indica DSM 11827]
MPVWLITGASRGIGLGFVQALAQDPENAVLATCRSPEEAVELQDIASASEDLINLVQLDHENADSCRVAAEQAEELLGELPIDYIINNAAFAFGPTMVYQTFYKFLMKSERPVVVNISSGAASIAMDLGPSAGAYSVSKAALNMLTYKLAKENPKAIIVSISPGWVKTDMGGSGAQIEVADSVRSMIKLIQGLKPQDSGLFLNREGKPLPY